MKLTIKKVSKANAYAWAGIGIKSIGEAARYTAIKDGEVIATISRVEGGGYMEPTRWEARATKPMLDSFGRLSSNVIVASGPTLKAVKSQLHKQNS